MATKEDLYNYIREQKETVSLATVAAHFNSPVRNVRVQVKRMIDRGLVVDNMEALQLTPKAEESKDDKLPPSMVDEKTAPRETFEDIGSRIGCTENYVSLGTDQVFGGDYNDLKHVYKALISAGIRIDLAQIWVNCWANKINQPVWEPSDFASLKVEAPAAAAKSQSSSEDTRVKPKIRDLTLQSYNIDPDTNILEYKGEGLGTLRYEDAVELAKVSKSNAPKTEVKEQVSQTGEMMNLFKGMKDLFAGPGGEKKSYLVHSDSEGNMEVEEAPTDGRPLIMPANPPKEAPTFWYVDPADNRIKQSEPGAPVLLQQPAAQKTEQATYLIDKRTGEMTKHEPGTPIIIQVQPPPTQGSTAQINVGDGKFANLTDYIIVKKFENEEKRLDESHKTKVDMASGVKSFLESMAVAATRAAGGKK